MISEFIRYCPKILVPAPDLYKIDILRNLYGEPLTSSMDSTEVSRSLRRFEDFANKGDYLNELFFDCAKENSVLPDGKIFVRSYYLDIDHRVETDKKDPGESYFQMDGDYAFSLGVTRKRDTIWLAATSFSLDPHLEGVPVVVHLQGRSFTDRKEAEYSEKRKEAIFILGKSRWDSFLLFFTADRARAVPLPAVYLQPAEQNEYARRSSSLKDDEKTLKMEKAKRRYNGTARGLRLKIDSKTGMYIMPLEYPKGIDCSSAA